MGPATSLVPVLCLQARAAEVGFIARPEVAVDLRNDRAHEDAVEVRTRLVARARDELQRGHWFLEVQGEHELFYGDDLEAAWLALPGESGWEGPVGGLRVRSGLLIERWGKLDMLPVVDVLSPLDLRAGPLTSVDGARVAVPMLKLQTPGRAVRAELLLVPFSGADRTSFLGTDWSFIRQGWLEDLVAEAGTWPGDALSEAFVQDGIEAMGGMLSDLDPTTRRGLDAALGTQGLPQALARNGEVAMRLEAEPPGWDVAVMGGALRSHQALAEVDPSMVVFMQEQRLPDTLELQELLDTMDEPLVVRWPRTWMAGLEASTTVGVLGVRGEAGYKSVVPVRTEWMGAATSPLLGGGLGLDWMRGSTLLVSAEGRFQELLDAPDDLLLASERSIQAGGTVRWTFLGDRGALVGAGIYDFSFAEWLLRPQVTWRARDSVELGVGALVLEGPVAPASDLRSAMTFAGGPLSYFGDNDAITASVAWIR